MTKISIFFVVSILNNQNQLFMQSFIAQNRVIVVLSLHYNEFCINHLILVLKIYIKFIKKYNFCYYFLN